MKQNKKPVEKCIASSSLLGIFFCYPDFTNAYIKYSHFFLDIHCCFCLGVAEKKKNIRRNTTYVRMKRKVKKT